MIKSIRGLSNSIYFCKTDVSGQFKSVIMVGTPITTDNFAPLFSFITMSLLSYHLCHDTCLVNSCGRAGASVRACVGVWFELITDE